MRVLGREIWQKFKGQNQPVHWNITEEKVEKFKTKYLQQNKDREEKTEL